MFKLKPGNVFQKINKMDKKQAYTWGAIVVVCFIALMTLASFMGNAEDTSFDDFNTRGYDLAQMPFINDEAEEYLLASKYPDMKNNGSTMLYSQAEKEARQEADAEAAMENAEDNETSSSSSEEYNTTNVYKSKGYTGGGRGAGAGTPTQVGTLGSASMGHAGGSGVSGTFGAPRGDFSPYKSQEKGSEIPVQFKNSDAKRALAQFAQTSRAAAGLKDNKNANAKRALMGGSIRGSDAFTDSGVDLSKTAGLELDTNAPVSSADLSNLDKAVGDGVNQGKDDKDDFLNDLQNETNFWEQLGQNLLNAGVQIGLNYAVDGLAEWRAKSVGTDAAGKAMADDVWNGSLTDNKAAVDAWAVKNGYGNVDSFLASHPNAKVSDFVAAKGVPSTHSPVPVNSSGDSGNVVEASTARPMDNDFRDFNRNYQKTNNSAAWKNAKNNGYGDAYARAYDDSYENNFWGRNRSMVAGSLGQAFSGAVNGGNNNNNGGGYNTNYNYNSGGSRRSRQNNNDRVSCTTACNTKSGTEFESCMRQCLGN